MIQKREERLQIQICRWLKYSYPKTIFTCDLASGMKLSIGQAVKSKQMRSSKGMPDLMIFEPRGIYGGLFIELKKGGTKIFKSDGTLYGKAGKSAMHIKEQFEILNKLKSRGYCAVFGIGFTDTITKINAYMET